MVRCVVVTLLSAALLGPGSPRPQTGDTGTVSGTVKLTQVKGTPLPSTAYPGRTVGDRQAAPSAPNIKDVVVYIKDASYRGTLTTRTSELKQDHEMFAPHVLAISRGSTVSFPNADPFFHNVFSLSSAARTRYGRTDRRSGTTLSIRD